MDSGCDQRWVRTSVHPESSHSHPRVVEIRLNQVQDSARHEVTSQGSHPGAPRQTGNRGGQEQEVPRVLQSHVPCTKEERQTSSYHRSHHSERLPSLPIVQDGNVNLHLGSCTTRSLGYIPRPHGCVLPCSNSSKLQEVPPHRGRRSDLPVPSSPLRVVYVSSGLHQHAGSSVDLPSLQRDRASSLSGRFPHPVSFQAALPRLDSAHASSSPLSRLGRQPREVRPGSVTRIHPCRGFLQHSSRDHASTKGSNFPHSESRSSPARDSSSGQGLRLLHRTHIISRETSSARPPQNTTHTTVSDPSILLGSRSSDKGDHSGSTNPRSGNLVDRPGQSSQGHASGTVLSGDLPLHRRLQDHRLGSSCATQLPSIRILVVPRAQSLDQCLRAPRSSESLSTSSGLLEEQEGHGRSGQLHCSSIHQQAGRNQVSGLSASHLPTVSPGPGAGNDHQSSSHPGSSKLLGRSPVPSQPEGGHGMDPGSAHSSTDLQTLGKTSSGSDGHKSNDTTPSLRQSVPGPSSLRSRRNVLVLGKHGRVHLSSVADDSSCPVKSSAPSVCSHSSTSPMAKQSMVSVATSPAHRLSETSTLQPRRHLHASQRHATRSHQVSEPTRLSAIIESGVEQGLSREVSERVAKGGRGDSTHRIYDSKWNIFSIWCGERGHDPLTLSVARVADFFIHLFHEGKAPVTIEGYRSAIDSVWLPSSGRTLQGNIVIRELIANFKVERPRAVNTVPKWDLNLVLRFLRDRPEFHPKNIARCHKYFAQKTVFLVLLATAKRCQDVHAMDPKRVSDSPRAVIVPPFPGFLPKIRSTAEAQDRYAPISVKKLSGVEAEELLLCPARTLLHYHKWASKRAPQRARFFVSNSFRANPVGLNTISSWTKALIRSAYLHTADDSEALALAQARPHEVRAVASSLALQATFALNDILAAAQWSTPSIFAAHYLRDVSMFDGKLHTIGHLIVANKQI